MNTQRKIIPAILLFLSLPFYFIGIFSLHTDRGIKLVGSMRFWYIGLTGDYSPYQQYFYTKLANFINAVVILFILSIVFMTVYLLIIFCAKKISTQKRLASLLLAFDMLSFGCYLSGIIFELLFYSNKFHACYVIQGEGRLGYGILVGVLLHIASFVFNYINYLEYVFNPYLFAKRCKKDVSAVNIDNKPKAVQTVQNIEKTIAMPNKELKYYLICDRGDFAGGKVELKNDREIKIGKDPRYCAFVISKKYKKVSRVHCGVLRKGRTFYVIDYSTNGTFFNAGDQRMQTGGVLNKINTDQMFNLARTDNEFYCKIEID